MLWMMVKVTVIVVTEVVVVLVVIVVVEVVVDVGNLREGDARKVVQGEAWSQSRAFRKLIFIVIITRELSLYIYVVDDVVGHLGVGVVGVFQVPL